MQTGLAADIASVEQVAGSDPRSAWSWAHYALLWIVAGLVAYGAWIVYAFGLGAYCEDATGTRDRFCDGAAEALLFLPSAVILLSAGLSTRVKSPLPLVAGLLVSGVFMVLVPFRV